MSMLSTKDRLDISDVAVGFFLALDRFDYTRVLSLLTSDIQWIRPSGTLNGHEQVAQALNGRSRTRATRHLASNVDIQAQDPNTARVNLDLLVFQRDLSPSAVDGPLQAPTLMSTSDILRREAGRWQIAIKRPGPSF